jgi:flavin reductase (DIM6/NTAB) family NADH-FMN oxidoreductase RutF
MNEFSQIKPEELNKNPFKLIGSDWMLITAEKDDKINTMTASWGGLGVMWGKNVAFVVIRPQRYTKQYVDGSDTFSLTFFDNSFKKILSYLGSVSGRDEDKISKTGLKINHLDNTPYFEEASMVIFCKKLYTQDFKPECFISAEIDKQWYSAKDHHMLYIAEIEKVLIKE